MARKRTPAAPAPKTEASALDYIATDLRALARPLSALTPDPKNARAIR